MEQLQKKLSDLHHLSNLIESKTVEKNTLKNEVMTLIKAQGLEKNRFEIGNRLIQCKREKKPGGLTQSYLKTALRDYFGPHDQQKAVELFQYILDHRPVVEHETLDIAKKGAPKGNGNANSGGNANNANAKGDDDD